MKFWKIFWGFGIILLAVGIILNALGILDPMFSVVGGITVLQAVLALFVVSFIVTRVVKLKLTYIFIPLSLLFMIFERNIAFMFGLENENIINNWVLLLCSVLISVGISLLKPVKRKRRKKREKNITIKCNRFASATRYIDCESFVESDVHNYLGDLNIYFENTDSFVSGARLNVYNRLGQTVIYVPREWTVKNNIVSNLANIDVEDHGDSYGPVLIIDGENNLGNIEINYI